MRNLITIATLSLLACSACHAADKSAGDSKTAADSKTVEPSSVKSELTAEPKTGGTSTTSASPPLAAKAAGAPVEKGESETALQSEAVDDLDRALAKADSYADQDKYEVAIAAYKAILKSVPGSSKAHERLAAVYLQNKNIASACAEDVAAIKLDPKNAAAHQHLGLIAGMSQNFAGAIEEEKAAIAIKPDFQEAYAVLGKALSSSNRYDEALNVLNRAIAIDPTDIDSYLTLAAVYGRKSNYKESIRVYKQALTLNPKSWMAHTGLGQAYGHIGDNQGQVAELKLAAQYGAGDASAHGHLGSALSKVGDIKGALTEGAIANQLRFGKYWPSALNKFLLGWACVFLLFGLIFGVLFAGSVFKPQAGEQLVKSFFLVFYKERPGRFIITSRRFLYVPEAFSRWFGSTRVSIERDLIVRLVMTKTQTGGNISLDTADGSSRMFKMSNLIFIPLTKELEKLGYSQEYENQVDTLINVKHLQ